MDIELIAIVAIISATILIAIRSLPTTRKKARRDMELDELLSIKDEQIASLREELRSLRGKFARMNLGPEEAKDVHDIVSSLPKWARPFAKGIIDWANEHPDEVNELIKKFTQERSKEAQKVEYL